MKGVFWWANIDTFQQQNLVVPTREVISSLKKINI